MRVVVLRLFVFEDSEGRKNLGRYERSKAVRSSGESSNHGALGRFDDPRSHQDTPPT